MSKMRSVVEGIALYEKAILQQLLYLFHLVYSNMLWWFSFVLPALVFVIDLFGGRKRISKPMLQAIYNHCDRMDKRANEIIRNIEEENNAN